MTQQSKLDTALEHGADDVIMWDASKTLDGSPADDDEFVRKMNEKSGGGFDGIIDIVGSNGSVARALKGLKVVSIAWRLTYPHFLPEPLISVLELFATPEA